MQILGIITIQILEVTVIKGDLHFLQCVYFINIFDI